jgi:hypothetical protein
MSERNAPEQRTVDVDLDQVRAEGNTVRGHAAVFNVLSEDLGGFRERVLPGAFSGVLDADVRLLVNHDPDRILARTKSKTLRISQDDQGLAFEAELPDTSYARDLRESIRRRDVDGASFRFVVGEETWAGDVREIRSVRELHDLTIATVPAYPDTSIELRARAPRVTHEPDKPDAAEERQKEATMPENEHDEKRSSEEKRDNEGGLSVESRVVEPPGKDLVHEVSDFAADVKRGETRSLGTAIELSNPDYSTQLFDALRPSSAFLRSGVRTLTTDSDPVIYPTVATDPTLGWVSEAGTISFSDPAFGAGTAVPHKLSVIVQYSNEVAEDSTPALEGVPRQVLLARAGVTVDVAAYEGSGAAPVPTGMGNVAGIAGTVNASAAATNIAFAGSAISLLEGANAPRPYAYVGSSNLPRHLREVRVDSGGTVGPYLFGVGEEELPTVWGARGYVNSALAAGTAYFYSPSACFVVNRTQGFDIEVDRSRLFHTDMSEMRLRARLDYFWPYPSAIVKGTAVPA